MRRLSKALVASLLLAIGFGVVSSRGLGASSNVLFTMVTSGLAGPIGIDWLPDGLYADHLLVSENFDTGGVPNNFRHLDRTSGASAPWGGQAGWNDEIYFASVRPGQPGGWLEGDVYSAEGSTPFRPNITNIARFGPDGALVNPNFATLVGETKLKRGGITFDRFGVAGGDMIVIASNYAVGPSDVYRVNASGGVTHLVQVPAHLEGITTVPGNSSLYGPWAGKILSHDEVNGQIWTIDPGTGGTATYGPAELGTPGGHVIGGEDVWVIPENSDFYGVENGAASTGRGGTIWKVGASQWTSRVGQILVAQELGALLYAIHWNPAANGGAGGFVSELVNDGSAGPGNWEHITFAPQTAVGNFVWNDLNGNGLQDGGEPGVQGVTVNLYTCLDALVGSTTTDAGGAYSFTGLNGGCYYVTFVAPGRKFTTQGVGATSSAPDATGKTPSFTLVIGQTNNDVDAGLLSPIDAVNDAGATVSGITGGTSFTNVLVNDTLNGVLVFPADVVTTFVSSTNAGVTLSGTNVVVAAGTPAGSYSLVYKICQVVNPTNCDTATVTVPVTVPAPTALGAGDTATIGFWHNKNGQALIKAVNGGPTSKSLATWLATNFPYLYGANSSNNLTGKTNTDVAALFMTFFNKTGQKTDAQVMGGALAAYVTSSSLAGGTYAAGYGFNVSTAGTGAKVYNVGSNGTLIGLLNNTTYTVVQLLKQANLQKQAGTFNANAFNTIFDGINQKGDII